MYENHGEVSSIDELLDKVGTDYTVSNKTVFNWNTRRRELFQYINLPSAFDTESTSAIVDGKKQAWLWCWQIGINGWVYIGRTIEELNDAIIKIVNHFNLHEHRKMLFFVHNLQHDFQFIRKYYKWEKTFSREVKKIISANLGHTGVEFRCSRFLCGCSLEQVGKDLTKYKVLKLVGDLDYDLIRTPDTPIREEERPYLINDVLVVMSRIQLEIEEAGGAISEIPLTKTGKVRKYCRDKCLSSKSYLNLIATLTMSPDLYSFCKEAFCGGFTHASSLNAGVVHKNVASFDFTSSYPACMLLCAFPMSKGEKVFINSREEYEELIKTRCVIARAKFTNVREKFLPEHLSVFRRRGISVVRKWTKRSLRIMAGSSMRTNLV